MTEALDCFADPGKLTVVHQTGPDDEDWVRAAYERSSIQATVQGFFNDMATRYAWADVMVCRAGATTVAEITAVGRAAVMIPFPQAADDHQTKNAQALVAAGAAVMIPQAELDGRRLAGVLEALMADRARLTEMADRARSLGRPEAAVTIVKDLYSILDRKTT
jgi:UDP-N-acetylglucosamine--N-acetylmuramyl-(pentapeptide) pyrophosphoryl-undecaprenol N-acetylglucosamine transferase